MPDSVRVLLVEDDPFARNWMALLLARDWRTYVAGDVASPSELASALRNPAVLPVHLVLLDIEVAVNSNWLTGILQALDRDPFKPDLIALATHIDPAQLRQLRAAGLRGFLLKQEIHHSLAWAAALAGQGHWVMTPSVEAALTRQGLDFPDHSLVLDGRKACEGLSAHETDVARLALLYSLERRELAHELGVTADWSYGLVSALYPKLRLEGLLNGTIDPHEYFYGQKVILAELNSIRNNLGSGGMFTPSGQRKKVPGIESLAFHILTMPEMR